MKKIKIAVTGGIGAGKSLVSDFFEKHGFPVLRADLIAKEIMQSNSEVQQMIEKEFGSESFIDGKTNTNYLAEKVFSVEENVVKINEIVHPPTMNEIELLTKKHFEKTNIVFVETALVFEANLEDHFDYLILVYANEKVRLSRVLAREKSSETEIRKRMNFQIPDEEKKDHVDFVIENNSSVNELENRCNFILAILKSMCN